MKQLQMTTFVGIIAFGNTFVCTVEIDKYLSTIADSLTGLYLESTPFRIIVKPHMAQIFLLQHVRLRLQKKNN